MQDFFDLKPVNFNEKLKKFNDFWKPKVIAEMNDYQFKLVKIINEFVWHKHDDTDEVFIVINGEMKIEFKDRKPIKLQQGEMFVIPKGVEHKPSSEKECNLLIIEPKGVINTGSEFGAMTAENDVWV